MRAVLGTGTVSPPEAGLKDPEVQGCESTGPMAPGFRRQKLKALGTQDGGWVSTGPVTAFSLWKQLQRAAAAGVFRPPSLRRWAP